MILLQSCDEIVSKFLEVSLFNKPSSWRWRVDGLRIVRDGFQAALGEGDGLSIGSPWEASCPIFIFTVVVCRSTGYQPPYCRKIRSVDYY